MGAYAWIGEFDSGEHPGLMSSSKVRPLYSILYHWGHKGMFHENSNPWNELISVERMLLAHEAMPYTLSGFKAWLKEQEVDIGVDNAECIAAWDQWDFDTMRDFVRYCALNRLCPKFDT